MAWTIKKLPVIDGDKLDRKEYPSFDAIPTEDRRSILDTIGDTVSMNARLRSGTSWEFGLDSIGKRAVDIRI